MTTTPTAEAEKDDGVSVSQSGSALHGAPSGSEPSGERVLIQQAWGALNFILAFYEPGQRYLDTEAWKQAEAGGKRAHDALSEHLGNTPGWWRRK